MRILLVDDSALIRNSMQAVLEPFGVELGHAENGEVALAKATSSRWDLIFLDVVMPVMDGPTALKRIREAGIQTPVVLVTSVSTSAVVASAVKLGAVHYIAKPFEPAMISSIAKKLLGLDDAALANPPRVLVQSAGGDLARQLAKLLPAYVAIDHSDSLGQSLERCETHRYELALFETEDTVDEAVAIAGLLREPLGAAGIFAVHASGTPTPWRPQGPLDGVLPWPLPPALGRGFLHVNFLRSLAFVDGNEIRAASFQGPPAHHPAYLAMLERRLHQACARLDLALEVIIDLIDVAAPPDAVAALATRMHGELKGAGGAPAFRVPVETSSTLTAQQILLAAG